MKFKALKTGSITNKDGERLRFWAGQTIDVTKSDFDIDFDEHDGFEKADSKSKDKK